MFKKVDNTPDGYTKMTKRETKAFRLDIGVTTRKPKDVLLVQPML